MEVKNITDVREYGDEIQYLDNCTSVNLELLANDRLKIINSVDVFFGQFDTKSIVSGLLDNFCDLLTGYAGSEANGEIGKIPTMRYLCKNFYILSQTVSFLVDIGECNKTAMMREDEIRSIKHKKNKG